MQILTSAAPIPDDQSTPIKRLLAIMERLRNKENGCPWDIEQDFKSIAPCTIEEAYEVADAIARGHMDDLKEELGDLLLQVVFHAQMAKEQNLFDFDDVANRICQKLISRHPHVFGEAAARNADDVLEIWQASKDKEKAEKAAGVSPKEFASILDDIPNGFPSLMRAQKISKRAAKSGFEWQETSHVIDKIIEELNEFRAEIHSGNKQKQEEELGDVFFTLVNLGRRLDIDCESAMQRCNVKFVRRFSGMERDIAADSRELKSLTPDEWDSYWVKQKDKEREA